MLANRLLTRVSCLLSVKTNNDSSHKAEKEAERKSKSNEVLTVEESVLVARRHVEQEARRKSKCDEVLNETESRFMIRYCHPTSCCSLAHSTTPAH